MKIKLMIIGTLLIGAVGGFFMAQDILTGNAKENIDANEAKSIALKKFNGEIVEFEYDKDAIKTHYEFEIVGENEKVDIEVDAKTGNVTIKEREAILKETSANSINNSSDKAQKTPVEETTNTTIPKEDVTSKSNLSEQKENLISQDKAISIALAKVKGQVTDVELDNEHGKWIYEIEVKDGIVEYDFDIDAKTGKIVKFEKDIDND